MKDGKIVGDVKQQSRKVSHVASLANNNGAENKEGFSLNIERLVNYLEISLAPEEKVIFEKKLKNLLPEKRQRKSFLRF